MNRRLAIACALLLQACGSSGTHLAQNPAPSTALIKLTRVFPNLSFTSPLALVQAPTDPAHWYLIEQPGRVMRFDSTGSAAASVALDISAQVTSSGETGLLGKMLRIDVRATGAGYAVPADNPYAANAQCALGVGTAPCPEIWAFGFRNPWRWSFDKQNGELWVGDVGQGSWEEVDRVTKGGNYGWRLREGAHCYQPPSGCPQPGDIEQGSTIVDPVTEYDHGVGQAITGGYVYRGSQITALTGRYVFADYGSGRIWTHTPGSANLQKTEQLDSTANIASFGEGLDGELYVLDLASGQILQLQAVP